MSSLKAQSDKYLVTIENRLVKIDKLTKLNHKTTEAYEKFLGRHPDQITPKNRLYAPQYEVTRLDILDL